MEKKLALTFGLIAFAVFSNAQAGDKDLTFTTACSSSNKQAILSFVGDILIHKALYQVVVADTKHFSQIWQKTDPLIKKADYSVANLEGPAAMGIDGRGQDRGDIGFVYDGSVYSGTNMVFNYHPRIMSDLKNSGYDLIQTANNHAMDRFSIGVDKTLDAAAVAGLNTTGSVRANETQAPFFHIESINGVNVAFLSCTENTNGIPDNGGQILLCLTEKTLTIIKKLNSMSTIDSVIVLPHWGIEYKHTPEAFQKSWARKYLEAGATAVIGSHPHVLQPWEKYVTSDNRETLILYSLGNFVAGQRGLARKVGPVAYIGLSKVGGAKAKIHGVGYTPTRRDGAVLYPVGAAGPIDVLNHTALMYGSKARVEPTSDLKTSLCVK